MDPKTPRERLRETLEASRRESENWPQWMKDAPSFFQTRPTPVPQRERKDETDR